VKPELRGQVEARLRRIAGQVGGIQRMLDEDRYCVDVLLQVAAVRAALEQVGKLVLAGHVETCVAAAFASGSAEERARKRDELLEVFARFGALDAGPAGSEEGEP
jgi:CsoR family transcriptional regulator, copper-sensing transcriptional repressor